MNLHLVVAQARFPEQQKWPAYIAMALTDQRTALDVANSLAEAEGDYEFTVMAVGEGTLLTLNDWDIFIDTPRFVLPAEQPDGSGQD